MDLLLSARTVTADEGRSASVWSTGSASPTKCFLPRSPAPATTAISCAPSSMAAIKAQVSADWHRTSSESLTDAVARVADPAGRPDFKEGVASYVERRPPRFRPLPPRIG